MLVLNADGKTPEALQATAEVAAERHGVLPEGMIGVHGVGAALG